MQGLVLVLGASGTIGGAIARRLAADGHALALHGGGESDRLAAIGEELDAPTFAADLSDPAAVGRLFEDVAKLDRRLTGLVFAVARPFPHKLAHRTGWATFDEQMSSQIKALHHVLTAAKPMLEDPEEDARVIVLSTEYVLGAPPIKIAPYVAAKAALTAYARVAAQELLKSNIRVHILAPGMVKSALTADMPDEFLDQVAEGMPEKRLTAPEDVAEVARFLMRPEGDSLYGTVIPVTRATRR